MRNNDRRVCEVRVEYVDGCVAIGTVDGRSFKAGLMLTRNNSRPRWRLLGQRKWTAGERVSVAMALAKIQKEKS